MSRPDATLYDREEITVAIVQLSPSIETAFGAKGVSLGAAGEEALVRETRMALVQLASAPESGHRGPDVVLFPELLVPSPRGLRLIRSAAREFGWVILAGTPWIATQNGLGGSALAANTAEIAVGFPQATLLQQFVGKQQYFAPSLWRTRMFKLQPSYDEEKRLHEAGYDFMSGGGLVILDHRQLGRFGILICYDATSMELLTTLQGAIHHLVVLAYNKDTGYYRNLAEVASRELFCNAIVCNAGHYGGSVALTPIRNPHERIRYEISGQRLFSVQSFRVPLRSLEFAQHEQLQQPDGFKTKMEGYQRRREHWHKWFSDGGLWT